MAFKALDGRKEHTSYSRINCVSQNLISCTIIKKIPSNVLWIQLSNGGEISCCWSWIEVGKKWKTWLDLAHDYIKKRILIIDYFPFVLLISKSRQWPALLFLRQNLCITTDLRILSSHFLGPNVNKLRSFNYTPPARLACFAARLHCQRMVCCRSRWHYLDILKVSLGLNNEHSFSSELRHIFDLPSLTTSFLKMANTAPKKP